MMTSIRKLNVLIPMAGNGARFASAGYNACPKPLIDVNGHPMIWHVVKTLGIMGKYIFVVLKEHLIHFPLLEPLLRSLAEEVEIVISDDVTDGPAATCLLAKHLINNEAPLLIANCDQIMYWDSRAFLNFCKNSDADGVIVTYSNSHPKNSFIRLDAYNNVIEIKEKEPISDIATVGLYWWKQGDLFVRSSLSMVKANERYNNEFYVAPAYNQLLKDPSHVVSYYHVEEPHLVGTPEDLKEYLET